MHRNQKMYRMVMAALLCAIGIVIPMFSPLKITLEPASFTLASHVAIFVAMFISPTVAISVCLGTTVGFFFGGFPIVVVMRAFSQVIFAGIGSFWLQKHPGLLSSMVGKVKFNFVCAVIHGLGEMLIVLPFYMSNSMSGAYYAKGFFISVVLLVGVGTVVHSTVDFAISLAIWAGLKRLAPDIVGRLQAVEC